MVFSQERVNQLKVPYLPTGSMLVCDHQVVHEDFKFLGTESNRYLLEVKESLFLKRDRPSLNNNLYSQEL